MSTPFLGQIKVFAFDFVPKGWLACNGQLLPIQSNAALFALLGTFYGGNGTTTFGLPNLQRRLPISWGTTGGCSVGEIGGEETHPLTASETPSHAHTPMAVNSTASTTPNTATPAGSFCGAQGTAATFAPSGSIQMASGNPASAGGGLARENRPPYLVMNYCVATAGVFPSRN